jgi:hypothetical protein
VVQTGEHRIANASGPLFIAGSHVNLPVPSSTEIIPTRWANSYGLEEGCLPPSIEPQPNRVGFG